ncbi:hypothetical protein GQ43DRAFT_341860, partial [Delitschia confertaspora ATCC 74209]
LSGAFDNVSPRRLEHLLGREKFPDWARKAIRRFISNRKTTLVFNRYTSDQICTPCGIPQGSP